MADRDRTVSRRSEPSSRTALNGEQPYPWDLLQPQDAMSRHRGAKLCRRYELLGKISLLSRSTFCPLSDDPSTQNRQITMTYFRTCSTCMSRSQATLCHCAYSMISNHAKVTFARLRYSLGGDRPSQTAHLTLSMTRITGHVRNITDKGWYFTNNSAQPDDHTSKFPTYPTHHQP